MQTSSSNSVPHCLSRMLVAAGITLVCSWACAPAVSAAAAPTLPISQTPMTVNIPAHPQILLAVANSQSMDGDLSGAIRTGSGSLGAAFAGLQASSSPVNYTIPAGFTPPANPGAGGVAPYTVASGGQLLDNSASRMNVAKGGLTQILNTYISSADFALTDYSTNGLNEYTTWVYQMSQAGGFTFTSTLGVNIPGTIEYLPNPCYLSNPAGTDQVSADCNNLNGYYAGKSIFTKKYLVVGFSSDDPSVNDVLYAGGGIDPLCVVFGGPTPPNPFPNNFTLGDYNTGGVSETYAAQVGSCATTTGPTNAGFVPFSTEVMYEQRGFGFYTNGESAGGSNPEVPMTSSGATPTPASVAAALAAFAPLLAPETNSSGTKEMKSSATQSPMAGLIAGAQAVFSKNPPSTNGCVAQQYVILITDGLPTLDLAGHAWPPLGSTAATGYGVSATFNADHSLGVTNDQALTDVIANIAALKAKKINTYVIGLGAGVDATVNPTAAATLQAMAIAGGTGTASPTGFFPATSPAAMTNDLQIIITKILAATQSVASAAVNSTGLNTNSVVYQSQFLTSDSNQDWDGNLRAFKIAADGSVDTSGAFVWAAAPLLDALNWDTGRFIATWDPTLNAAIPFRWSLGAPIHGIANSTVLGQELTTFTADNNGQDVLEFLRGARAQELPPNGTVAPKQFRERTHRLGDIVGSDPLYIGAPGAANQAPSYVAFAAARATRPPVIYVGANDGMLHAFDATAGNELFAYIPRGVYANLVNLVNPYYNATHLFYVNGSPQASDVQFTDSTWHTVLVGTEGAGGNSVFALDVSDPAAISTESALAGKVLWDFTDPNMGLSFSTPAIASTANGWTVFVGNGYNSTNQKPYLYALNPQNGAVFKKIDLCAAVPTACNLSASNGLSGVIAVNSGGQVAGYANIVYAGDLQGNLWRVDVSNVSPAAWTVTVLFQATDSANNPQPITTAPVATLNPRYPQYLGTMVFVATGELLGNPDLSNGQVQSIYGIYDPPTTYAAPVTRFTGLIQQTLSVPAPPFNNVVLDTSAKVTIPADKGWFIDLKLQSGERVVTDPRLETGGALVLTSYTPSSIACSAGGSSNLYVINYATGGSFTSPQFDLNGDHAITSADSVGGANPVGLSLGNVFAAAPTIRTANLGSIGAVKLITKSNNTIQSIGEKGSSKSRTAWWEIRQ